MMIIIGFIVLALIGLGLYFLAKNAKVSTDVTTTGTDVKNVVSNDVNSVKTTVQDVESTLKSDVADVKDIKL